MAELAFGITLIVSFLGMTVAIYQKLPSLLKLPKTASASFNWKEFFLKLKNNLPLNNFSSEALLQKTLSKIRILLLRVDFKISSWLQRLRERRQKSKFGENDNYWQEIKKSTKIRRRK